MTLVELIVVVAILGVLATVVAGAVPSPRRSSEAERVAARIAAIRAMAIATRTPLHDAVTGEQGTKAVLALPDGSVLADSALHVDRYSGRVR